jgi:UDP-GlcNAc3NAcA epimerase
MKICTIIGARPQFIKAAVVSRAIALRNRTECRGTIIDEVIIHTGQHYEANMSDVFFDELAIPAPSHRLGIGGGTHGQNTGRMIEAIETVLLNERPDWALVYGDTDSTLAGTLAAAKLQIPIAHVEAGLRSFNRRMPEEINRILTDHASEVLFTPTYTATRNLQLEGVNQEKIRMVGDVMYDASIFYGTIASEKSTILERLRLRPSEFILATIHRAENTNSAEKMREIITGFGLTDSKIVWPMHPRTKKIIQQHEFALPPNIQVTEPVGYLDMIMLEKSARKIVTDSGGVQKEAYFFRVPCVTVRDETEWEETLDDNWNILAKTFAVEIESKIMSSQVPSSINGRAFGDGDAGNKIAAAF